MAALPRFVHLADQDRRYVSLSAPSKDPQQVDEIGIDGTIQYCEDLGVEPEDVVMLAVAWLTSAPSMGKFAKTGWIDGWKALKCVHRTPINGISTP